MKLALISSVGGHLTDLLALQQAFEGHEVFWVLNDVSPVLPQGARAYLVTHAERDLRVLQNLWEFAAVFAREQPDLMVSTGAGPAVPAAIVARLMGIQVIFIEPASAVTDLTLTGRLIRPLTRAFFVQWPQLRSKVPGARYHGGVL